MKSSTTVRSPKKRFLNTVAKAASAFAIEEIVSDVMEAVVSLHMSSEMVATQEALLLAMKAVCCVNKEEF